jgi:hypothetical protein
LKSHSVSLPELQFDRQPSRTPFGTRMKLCELPVQPLSRSVPCWPIVSTSSFGPPSGFATQTAVLRRQSVSDGFGLQVSFSLSRSVFGFAEAALPFILNFLTPFFLPLRFVLTTTDVRRRRNSPGRGRTAPGAG